MILLFIPDDNESSRMKQIETCFGTQAKKNRHHYLFHGQKI